MLTIAGGPTRYCDGVTRRTALKVGAFAFGATTLTLADLFRAEAAAAQTPGFAPTRHKALINIFLGGGPSHVDTFDPKPDAPGEVRGEFRAIPTAVPGLRVSEVFPLLAGMADKFAVLRSVVGAGGGHDAYQCTTGFRKESLASVGGRPGVGAVLSRVCGPVDPGVPPFVGLTEATGHAPWAEPGPGGFLGPAAGAFRPGGPDLANMTLNPVNRTQLGDRKRLLAAFDTLRRDADATGALAAMDAHTERALDVLLSNRLVDALDLSREDPRVRARYGDGRPYRFQADGAPTANDQFLLARRLVQAGARCVTLTFGRWDSHADNFAVVRDHGGKLDQALSALLWDLDRLDLLNDVTVVAWGEFGRTPRVNRDAGRDHWPQVSCAVLAGGGVRGGQAVGSTDRSGAAAKDRPVGFNDVFATLYHTLGLNPQTTAVLDPTGRPQHVSDGQVIRELV